MDDGFIPPASVGDHLRQDYLPDYNIKAPTLAKRLGVGRQRVVRLLEGARCDADMALRLARLFGTTPQFWLALQADYDLATARQESGSAIDETVEPLAAA